MTSNAWREIAARNSWEDADAIRTATMNDTPSLDVRIRFEGGKHRVQISEFPK